MATGNGALPTDRIFPSSRTSSHSNRNPFNAMSPSTTSLASPTTGASSAFGLGSGAFASFGSSKTPKTPGGALDFSTAVGGSAKTQTPTAEKNVKDLVSRSSKTSLADSKVGTPPPTHTLRHSWVFWFRPPISKLNGFVDYEKTLHAMAGFDTAEDFFKVYRHLKRPSALPLVSDYHIFKKGIRPVWEDDENKHGGKWIVRLKKGVADRYWEDLLFAIIGDQLAEVSEEICGAILSVRNGEDILSIWTRTDAGIVLKIKDMLKRVLSLPQATQIAWKSHDSSIQQRTAIDDARKEKSNQHSSGRNGNKDSEKPTSTVPEKK